MHRDEAPIAQPQTNVTSSHTAGVLPALERVALAAALAALGCPLLVVAAFALSLPAWTGQIGAMVAFAAALVWLPRKLPRALDGKARRRPILGALFLVLAVGASLQSARVVGYIVHPRESARSIVSDPFYAAHSCLSAYYTAARVSRRSDAPDLYDKAHYKKPATGSPLGEFKQDDYFYPPPFLLLPRAILSMTDDFTRVRAAWFVIEMIALGAALIAVARRFDGANGACALLLAPLVWSSLPMLATLQVGNFQPMAFALAMLAMAAFARSRDALGGALLAFAALSKIFPGILVLYLLVQRRFRAVAFTVGFSLAYIALALLWLGPAPFTAFVDSMLPRLSSGEAFGMLKTPAAIALNHSVPGLSLKLGLLGVRGIDMAFAAKVAWIYSAGLVVLTFFLAFRISRGRSHAEPLACLVLLYLASLRSPFTPDTYALIAPLWIAVLMFAGEATGRSRRGILVALMLAYAGLQLITPGQVAFGWPILRVLALAAIPQLIAWLIVIVALRNALQRSATAASQAAADSRPTLRVSAAPTP